MITRRADMLTTEHSERFGGKGVLRNTHFLDKDHAYGTGRLFSRSKLAPGCSVGWHKHEGELEVYYILSGTAKVSDNGAETILHAGDALLTVDGESHFIENVGDKDLEYVALILFDKTGA
ncbi:MAG: Oxalate-binding protein [Firmicutes bacterium]|nr:Oxalate-binding protein [candidate division NPL-UPA2 bacterium]MBT9154502.1 Oxalate-binding protein [candidate division NPL-UPA2 bacterium]MBT9155997.1 Oxalate-binding protein [candidate division NPL-UPA2 bacterium]